MFATPVNTYKYLSDHGIRPSVQRVSIMNYLIGHRTHPTADEIYAALSVDIPTLSKTTVYNTLSLLADRGAALHITLDPRGSRYDGDTSPHGHLLCTECGVLHDIMFDTPPIIPTPDGYHVNEVQVYYRGTCKSCLAGSCGKTQQQPKP